MKIDPKSEFIIRTKRKKDYYYPNNESNTSRNNSLVINYSANRLYKDYQIREKKLKKLKNELTPSFKPAINSPLPFYSSRTSRKNEKGKNYHEINNDNSYIQKYKKDRNNLNIKVNSQKSRNIQNKNFIGKKNSTISQYFSKKENYLKSTNVDSRNTKTIIINSVEKNNSQLEKIKENVSSIENSSSVSVSQKHIKYLKNERDNSNISSNLSKKNNLNNIKEFNNDSIFIQEENPIDKNIKIKNEKENEIEDNQNHISYKEKPKIITKPKNSSIFKPIQKARKNLSTSNIDSSSLFNNNKIAKNFYQNNIRRNRKSEINKSSKDLLMTNKFKSNVKKKVKIVEKPKVNKNPIINEPKIEETKNIEKSNIKKQSNNLNDFLENKFVEFKNENENEIVNNSDLFENLNDQNAQPKDEKSEEKKEIIEEEKSQRQLVKTFKFNTSGDDEDEQNEEEEESSTKIIKENKSNEWIKKLEEISKNEELKTERDKNGINKMKKNGASTTRAQTKRIDSDRERIKNKKNVMDDEDKLYILNYRNSSSTAYYHPYTFRAKDPIFYKFFLKQK